MEDYVFIYFHALPGDYALGDIEDDLDDLLQGTTGRVTGSGMGMEGGNIDIEFEADADVLPKVIYYLTSCGFDGETILDINGERRKLSEIIKQNEG